MANSVPDTYPSPDPLSVSTGLALTARRVAPLPAAIAWNRANLGARSLIAQSWPERAGRWMWTTHSAAYPAEPCAAWRIPALPGRTTVEVYAVAFTAAARTTHEILIGSVGSGASVVLTPNAALGLLGPATLAINTAGGYDEIRAWARGDGTGVGLFIASIMVKAPALASPLPAGSVGGYVATDPDEYAVLRPLDALEGRQMLSDLEAIEETPQVYAQWSAITGGEVDPDDGRTFDRMHARPHSVVGPVWDRTERLHRTLAVHARLGNDSGEERLFVLNAGAGWDVYDPARAVIAVPSGTPPTWYETTIQLLERRTPMPLPRGLSSTMLTVWPVGTYRQDALGPAHGHVSPAALTTCAVHSLSAWGI